MAAKFTNLADMFVGSVLAKLPDSNTALATMTEQEKQNLKDRAMFGAVINKQGAIAEATIKELRSKGEEQFRLLDAGLLTAETNAQLNAQYGEEIKNSVMGQKDIAIDTNQFAQSVASLLKGNSAAEKMDDRMATLLNVSSSLQQQLKNNTDTDFNINEVTGQTFNTDLLKVQWSELIEDLKSKNTQTATSSYVSPASPAPVNSKEIADMIGQTISQSNEALRGVLEQQTDILRSNMNRLDDLVSAVDSGTNVNRRMYYEST
jgi:hypothetical protein